MIIDLVRSGFDHLTLGISIQAPVQEVKDALAVAGLGDRSSLEGRLFFDGLGGFRKNGTNHHIYMRITSREDEPHMWIRYHRTGITITRPEHRLFRQINSLVTSLEAIKCTVAGSASCEVKLDDNSPIVALPLLRMDAPGAPFDEIVGIRTVRRLDDIEVESVILDLSDNNEMTVAPQIAYDTILNKRTPADALLRLGELRASFIVRNDTDKEKSSGR